MSKRVELNMQDLEEVSGGNIGWSKRNMTFTIKENGTVVESYHINDGMWDTFAELRDTCHEGFGGTYGDREFRDLLMERGVI